MRNVAPLTSVTPDTVAAPSQGSNTGSGQGDRSEAQVLREAAYRLVIEKGAGAGFVYKTVDRSTGEVVKQFPREQLIKMREAPDYSSGKVIDTRI